MRRVTLHDIIQLKFAGDPVIFFTEVKQFLESSISKKLESYGVEISFYSNLSSAFESNQEYFPAPYRQKADVIIKLLKNFEYFERPLNWHNGEEHDFPQLVKENESAIDMVLELLISDMKTGS